eukprot:TRINITY_DN2566_c0_g2_i1.p1 TRINITY_DN2566_c0_g2~~TRINITY_DN2566_c0_g2_i1.p1  ORF type:complete len:546 (-),score=79.64 TRINITY_DN2566_c0_g2_i1:69-1706(-)
MTRALPGAVSSFYVQGNAINVLSSELEACGRSHTRDPSGIPSVHLLGEEGGFAGHRGGGSGGPNSNLDTDPAGPSNHSIIGGRTSRGRGVETRTGKSNPRNVIMWRRALRRLRRRKRTPIRPNTNLDTSDDGCASGDDVMMTMHGRMSVKLGWKEERERLIAELRKEMKRDGGSDNTTTSHESDEKNRNSRGDLPSFNPLAYFGPIGEHIHNEWPNVAFSRLTEIPINQNVRERFFGKWRTLQAEGHQSLIARYESSNGRNANNPYLSSSANPNKKKKNAKPSSVSVGGRGRYSSKNKNKKVDKKYALQGTRKTKSRRSLRKAPVQTPPNATSSQNAGVNSTTRFGGRFRCHAPSASYPTDHSPFGFGGDSREPIDSQEVRPRLVFHGTDEKNFPSIFRHGLVAGGSNEGRKIGVGVAHGTAYKEGVYTARDPHYSLGYSRGGDPGTHRVLVCAALDVGPGASRYCGVLVLRKTANIMPLFVCEVQNGPSNSLYPQSHITVYTQRHANMLLRCITSMHSHRRKVKRETRGVRREHARNHTGGALA